MAKLKQAGLYEETHKLIQELVEARGNAGFTSKAKLIHDLVAKAHKREVRK